MEYFVDVSLLMIGEIFIQNVKISAIPKAFDMTYSCFFNDINLFLIFLVFEKFGSMDCH